ncbi:MAG: amidohydrolase family protein, partial [Pseudomonadota bacterium]
TFNAWAHNTELVADIFTQTGNEIPQNSVEITLPRAILGASRSFRYKHFGLLASFDLDLTFDCLGFPQHLGHFHTLLTRYPKMRAVIDHCMKPQIRNQSQEHLQMWADGMEKLANDTNAYCKLSGLVTECDNDISASLIKPYTDHVLKAFGPARVMWGSDWPVSRLRCEYADWFALAQRLTDHLTDTDKQQLFQHTARQFYRIAS